MTEKNFESKNSDSKDVIAIYKQNVERLFDGVRQSVPKYHQSITNVQQEYLQTFENIAHSTFELQRDAIKKSGVPTGMPEAAARTMNDVSDEVAKAVSIGNQMVLATMDAAQQNAKMYNDNAKSFASLNRDILRSWISAFSIKAS